MSRVPRWARVAVGLAGALVLLVVLSLPVVFRGGGSTCERTLRFAGRDFVARDADAVQALAIGTGVVSGCDAAPENVDVRSVSGVSPAVAVALPTQDASVYVAEGRCPDLTGEPLLRCLRRS
ncbi:MAG TPA: hypothetical protein VFJ77_11490 [Gaiellaceae bacterium]|nr:hypothetical protein [Gaiellaceae bacterium]